MSQVLSRCRDDILKDDAMDVGTGASEGAGAVATEANEAAIRTALKAVTEAHAK